MSELAKKLALGSLYGKVGTMAKPEYAKVKHVLTTNEAPQEWFNRLCEEYRECEIRIIKLENRLTTWPEDITDRHWILLTAQLAAMKTYLTIMQMRIDLGCA